MSVFSTQILNTDFDLHCDHFFETESSTLLLQIHILDLILKTADVSTEEGKRERSVANILLLKVFYDQTDTGILSFLVRLIKAYDRTKQPKA
jgi:hypothetical protein